MEQSNKKGQQSNRRLIESSIIEILTIEETLINYNINNNIIIMIINIKYVFIIIIIILLLML